MRWQGGRQSENVEDRRRMGGRQVVMGGSLLTLALVLAVVCMGGDPRIIFQLLGPGQGGGEVVQPEGPVDPNAPEDETTQFVKTILAQTEDVWRSEFRRVGKQYQD